MVVECYQMLYLGRTHSGGSRVSIFLVTSTDLTSNQNPMIFKMCFSFDAPHVFGNLSKTAFLPLGSFLAVKIKQQHIP